METPLKSKGRFRLTCYNPDGSLAWSEDLQNGVTTAGLNDMLNVYFGASSQRTTWYIGLIDNSGYTAVAAGDTMSSHSGWTESTAYTESNRQTWTPGSAAAGVIVNPTRASFTINAAATAIRGVFLASSNTKGGSSGQLWATALASSIRTLNVGQILKVDYTTTLAG